MFSQLIPIPAFAFVALSSAFPSHDSQKLLEFQNQQSDTRAIFVDTEAFLTGLKLGRWENSRFTRSCALALIALHVNKLSVLKSFWRPQIIVIVEQTLPTVRKQQKCDVKCGNYRLTLDFLANSKSTLIWIFRRHEQTLPYYPNSSNLQIKCEMLLQSIKIPLCCSFRNRFVFRHSSTRSVFCGN